MENFSFFSNNLIGGVIITFAYRYRKQIIIVSIVSIIIIGLISFFIYKKINTKEEIVEEVSLPKKIKDESKLTEELYKVDIKGEIIYPGIYTLKKGSRVVDVIEKAGGLTEQANTSVINLSKKITDEMVIIIYSQAQVEEFEKIKEVEKVVQEKCNQIDENSLQNDACINQEVASNGKISINTAGWEELMTLSGIGESKAKEIVAYREQNGAFESIDDLAKVPGIGENILAKIKENITL